MSYFLSLLIFISLFTPTCILWAALSKQVFQFILNIQFGFCKCFFLKVASCFSILLHFPEANNGGKKFHGAQLAGPPVLLVARIGKKAVR
jgi:hypothetical protein